MRTKAWLALVLAIVWASAACGSRQDQLEVCGTDADAFMKSMGGSQP